MACKNREDMRFRNIYIQENISQTKGIQEIKLNRLSNVVALVGKNGSGKSRILDLIEENLFKSLTIPRLLDDSISSLPKVLENFKSQILPLKDYFLLTEKANILNTKINLNSNDNISKQELRILNQQLRQLQIQQNYTNRVNAFSQQFSNNILPSLKQNHLRRINNNEIRQLQQAIAETKNDPTLPFENLFENIANNVNYDELKSMNKSALKFLSKLPHQLAFDKYECIANSKQIEDRISYKRFISLKKLIKDFLDKELTWEQKVSNGNLTESGNNVTFSGVWKINGRDFNYAEFSDGEKSLFAYALLFFFLDQNPKLSIKESIILIDEPELHLHPDSEIDLIDGIRKAIGENGQLIIATHSINILSHLNYEEIFMVKENAIKFPTQSTPGESLAELMSLNERVEKLSEFLNSISSWTYANFMAQCFSNPEVIQSSKQDDPQVMALKKTILQNISKSTNILLDFGAGKGRLYEQLKMDYEFIDKISYSALEPIIEFHTRLRELGASNIYKEHSDLPENSFDIFVLCNVLHEIEIDDWVATLNKIIKSLKTEGFLIIIEAKNLAKGEKIGTVGYLLLDLEELKELFNLESLPSEVKTSTSENKIMCALLPKADLKQISITNLKNCLTKLETNTLNKIEKLRKEEYDQTKSISFGRQSAFLSQQNINARLGLKYLNSKNSTTD